MAREKPSKERDESSPALLHFPLLLLWRFSLRALEIWEIFHEPAKSLSDLKRRDLDEV